MMRFYKNNKGITLVALVITIIILIILATVAVNAVFGDSGLLKYAQDARNYQANADSADAELINSATEYIDGVLGGSSSGGSTETEQTATTVSEAKNNGLEYKETTTIKDDLDNDVTIPGGFKIAEDSGTKVEEGIVIEDEIGNQFVWIPVGEYNVTTSLNAAGKLTNNLSRRTFTSSGATEVNGDEAIEGYNYGEGNENSVAKDQIEAFKESATTNEGFYIGRYEAGTEAERTSNADELTIPLVQANKYPYVYVTRDRAKTQAEAMYNGNSYVTSELISSYAWDTALNFICQTNEAGYTLATTSSSYGNIGTGARTLTGAYSADNYSNIHDFLGNCLEWTTEYSSSNDTPCVNRGGHYYGVSDNFAARRNNSGTTYSNSAISLRVQLYIK